MDFFLCFFMDIGRYLLRACGVIQTVIIFTVQKKNVVATLYGSAASALCGA